MKALVKDDCSGLPMVIEDFIGNDDIQHWKSTITFGCYRSAKNETSTPYSVNSFMVWLFGLRNSIVTLSSGEAFDIKSQGSEFAVGYRLGHELDFKTKLQSLCVNKGGIVVREFLPETFAAKVNGAIKRLPKKNIYHFLAHDGGIHVVPAREAEENQNTDARTGLRLAAEQGLVFKDFTVPAARLRLHCNIVG